MGQAMNKDEQTKPRKLPLEKTEDLAEGERDTVEEDLKIQDRKEQGKKK